MILLCHAPTSATLEAAFPVDEPLTPGGRRAAAALEGQMMKVGHVLCSPARRAVETVDLLGLSPTLDDGLRDCDFGRWAGLSLSEVAASEPRAASRWLADPLEAPHGGESVVAVCDRVARWLETVPLKGKVLAVTHAAVIRAAIIHALGAPISAFWRIDAAPLSALEMRRNGSHWSLQAWPVGSERLQDGRALPGGKDRPDLALPES